ncbi:unnamed protein product, partial [Urochloa humidicola]
PLADPDRGSNAASTSPQPPTPLPPLTPSVPALDLQRRRPHPRTPTPPPPSAPCAAATLTSDPKRRPSIPAAGRDAPSSGGGAAAHSETFFRFPDADLLLDPDDALSFSGDGILCPHGAGDMIPISSSSKGHCRGGVYTEE